MLSVTLRHALGDFALDVAFEAPPGLTVLFGRSGSGKTSVINAVAGLLTPAQGRISIAGRTLLDTATGTNLPRHHRRIGYVFQDARLFPHLSVRQNLLYGHYFAPRIAPRDSLDRVADLLGITPLLARRPGALSGGERARVALGRALLSAPDILLADEPLASLDDPRRAEILPMFERLRDEAGIPILYVSHSIPEVARLATTVVILRAGRVIATGPAATVLGDPATAPGLGIRAAGAVLSARVVAHHSDGLTELAAGGGRLFLPRIAAPPGARLRIRIAAQDVILSRSRPEGLSALNILPVTLRDIRPGEGPGALVVLDAGGEALLARITRRSATALGLAPGLACFAVMKSVAIAPDDIGTPDPDPQDPE